MPRVTEFNLAEPLVVMCDGAEERRLTSNKPFRFDDGRVILRRETAIATDAAPKHEPAIEDSTSWMTVIEPDRAALAEASLIASFYEGCPYATGRRQEAAYRLRMAERSEP